jgi:hypothetical protein
VHAVRNAILAGTVVAVLILTLFLRHARITAIAATQILTGSNVDLCWRKSP